MEFKVGDVVYSKICHTLLGRVSKILDDNNFLLRIHDKEIICHHKFYVLIKN